MVAGVLRGGESHQSASVMAALTATRSLARLVEDVLHALVRQARAEGHTWAEIGELLGTSRQAAFQRFGSSTTPRGSFMPPSPPTPSTLPAPPTWPPGLPPPTQQDGS
jgi:hypothetical protein